MNAYFVAASGLAVVGGILHSILGERLILSQLSNYSLPLLLGSRDFALRVLRLFWHMVSVAWWGFAATLLVLASVPASETSHQVALVVAATFFVSAGISMLISRGKHFSWPALLVIAILTVIGAS